MGGSSSKEESWRQNPSYRSDSSSWNSHFGYPRSSYGQESQSYAPQTSYAPPQYYSQAPQYYPHSQQEPQYHPPSQDHGRDKKTLQRRYSRIADNYNSLDQVNIDFASFLLEVFIYLSILSPFPQPI